MTKRHSKVGMRFGKLIVLGRSQRKPRVYWRCLCDCGKEAIVDDGNLTYGRTKSCGCGRRTPIVAGTRFNRLIALEEVQSAARGRGKAILWRCRCDCGAEVLVKAYDLRSGGKKSCGCLKYRRLTLLEKMDRHIRVTEEGCWIWGEEKNRYVVIEVNGRQSLAHRAVFKLFRGPIPDGMQVCHNCPGGDNPACCNPEHLWLGTNADNQQDAVEKGRTRFGERHWNSKLTAENAQEIFWRCHVDGETQASVAKNFAVHVVTVSDIVWRKTWRKATERLAQELGIL